MHPVLFQLGPFVVPSYGVVAAVGVLLALAVSQWTAPRTALNPQHAWNMLVLGVFAALVASRLLLIGMNLSDLRHHPRWLLSVAMVHHPLLTGVGLAAALVAVAIYVGWRRLPWRAVADCLAAPLASGMACEQLSALLAGSDYGSEASVPWAVTYSSPLAARWSGAPLGVPLHPVQAYAAVGAAMVAALCLAWLAIPSRRSGDAAGAGLLAGGAVIFVTEMFRDWEGRGVVFRGSLDTPQLVGLGMVLAGGVMLLELGKPAPRSAAV